MGKLERFHVVFPDRFIPRPRHDPDDRGGRRVFVECLIVVDIATDRIGTGKVLLRERFVDDDRTATAVKPGWPASCRKPYRMSWIIAC